MNHAQQRALERHGVELSDADLEEIMQMIDRGQAVKLRDGKMGAHVWCVEFRGLKLPVVYGRGRRAIFTVLPTPQTDQMERNARYRRNPRIFKQFDDIDFDDEEIGGDFCEIPHEHAVNTALRDQLAAIFGKQNA